MSPLTRIFVPLIFAICSVSTNADAHIHTGDRSVLNILYDMTNGPSWDTFSGWDFNSNNCSDFNNGISYGAFCNSDGRVITLELYSNSLNGTLPSDLGNLNELTYLDLSLNQLTGKIPNQLGNLVKLTNLYLNVNDLTEEIPDAFGNLTKLTVLYLYENQLTGKIPNQLGNLVELTSLYLYSNDLTGEIPDTFDNLINLWSLYLKSNDLTGQIPNSLANFSGHTLFLENNCFSCPHLFSCKDIGISGNCDLGDCGHCCLSYLPAPPVDVTNCTQSPCGEIECDGCEISDCQNSTVVLTCVNSVWYGPIQEAMCEDPCQPNPCYNGGSCVNEMDGFHCTCEEGFAGTACEISTVCANITCQNGGQHLDGHVESQCCCCTPGYSGTRCENKDHASCNPNPCLNGGTCTSDEDNDFTCKCQDGYEGNTCGKDIDDCANDPCENGGTCHDRTNSFSCCCVGGFAGDTCELRPCKQPYYIDPFGKLVKRELDNCANSHLVNAKKERYDQLIAARWNEERYATLTRIASIAGPALIGAAIGFAVMNLRRRR